MAEAASGSVAPDPTSPPGSASPQGVIHAALKLLPACQRCRRLRRKCDPSLPTCRQCFKSNSECCFYDHSLQQILPRSYVKSLIDRLQQVQSGRPAGKSQLPAVSVAPEITSSPEVLVKTPATPASKAPSFIATSPQSLQLFTRRSRDDHYLIPTASGLKTRYFGRSSVFSITVEVLARAQCDPAFSMPKVQADSLVFWEPEEFQDGHNCTITEQLVRSSIDLYMSSLNTVYPFLEGPVVQKDLEAYWQLHSAARDPCTLDLREAFPFFRITMMTAIAFASRSRHGSSWKVYDHACYLQASRCIETVTSEISVESLQALMLLIIYCLFHPRKGDIWKLLDYACRLSIELGYHTEQTHLEEHPGVRETRRSTFWSLYTIERIVGQLFGRPSDLPETIFTTKYPDITGTADFEDHQVAQKFSAAHHYRLVYLRSEIYKEMYLPSSPPEYSLDWYESRLSPILDWYRRTKPDEQLEGVGTITCSVAFHSTVIFVFQPLILHFLKKTRDKQESFTDPELFPEDGFYSACRLIQVYEKVVRAREDSVLGAYPMTFMSAHYCWMAAMTIMAHCLLCLDGRLTPTRLVKDHRLLQETASIQLGNLFEVSGSCLTLLMFCSEQWPGMMGMVDLYKKLSSRVLPNMIRKGLI